MMAASLAMEDGSPKAELFTAVAALALLSGATPVDDDVRAIASWHFEAYWGAEDA